MVERATVLESALRRDRGIVLGGMIFASSVWAIDV